MSKAGWYWIRIEPNDPTEWIVAWWSGADWYYGKDGLDCEPCQIGAWIEPPEAP